MPNLFVMAGPNGAGKTTTSHLILTGERRVEEFVNADIIAAEQGLDDIAAGRQMLRRLDELTAQRKDLAFETTLSSAGLRSRIAAMRDAGYVFHLIYIWIPSADMAVQRVAARVRSGGHSIPEKVIRRRYERSLDNFFNHYMPMADAWLMIDNSHKQTPERVRDGPLWQDLGRRYMKRAAAERQQGAAVPSCNLDDIYEAACRAVREALARHKALGQSVVVWRDGAVVVLKPEEICV